MRRGYFMLWEAHAFTPFARMVSTNNMKPNKCVARDDRVNRRPLGRVLPFGVDAEDGVNSAACLQVSLALSPLSLLFFIPPLCPIILILRLYSPRASTLLCLCLVLGQ